MTVKLKIVNAGLNSDLCELSLAVCVCARVLDEERPVALGQRSYVSQEASRRPNSLHIQRIRCPSGVYVSTRAFTFIHTHSLDLILIYCIKLSLSLFAVETM